MDIWNILWAGASWFTFWKDIYYIIKKYLKKSPINKSLQNDISDIAEKWATDTDTELILIMHDNFETLWLSDDIENDVYDLWNSDNKEINNNLEKIFSKTMEKLEWFFCLVSKQIEWYELGLNLVSQLNKEKEIIARQMDEDIWNLIKWYETLCKMLGSNDEDINKWLETFSILKNFLLEKIEELCDNIIWRFSKS